MYQYHANTLAIFEPSHCDIEVDDIGDGFVTDGLFDITSKWTHFSPGT